MIDSKTLLIYGELDSGEIVHLIVDKKSKSVGLLIKEIKTKIIWAEAFKNNGKVENFLAKKNYWEEVLKNGLDWN